MTDKQKQNNEKTVSRRDVLKGGAALGVAATAGTGVVAADGATELIGVDGYVGYDVPDEVIRYSGNPGIGVKYAEGEYSTISDWINGSDDRREVKHLSSYRIVTLSAPINHVTHAGVDRVIGDDPLEAKSYVEGIWFDVRMSLTDPISTLKAKSEASTPRSLLYSGAFDQTGVAYRDDVQQKTMTDAVAAVGADNVTADGSGVTVAVIDDGVSYTSNLFGSRVTAARNFISDTEVDPSATSPAWSAVASGSDHGTWVASAILGNPTDTTYTGVAPAANLIICKALDSDGGSTTDIAEAIRYSADNGADVINMSLGSRVYSPGMTDAIEYAEQNGVTVVNVASGNARQQGVGRFVNTPADVPLDSVMAVGATSVSTNADEVKSAYFSSVGPDPSVADLSGAESAGETVDIAAPGMEIEAQIDGSTKTYSGTSMATPLVSGVHALALSDSALSTEELVSRTAATATRVQNVGVTECGAGVIDAADLISNTESSDAQEDVLTPEALARDEANRSMGGRFGSQIRRLELQFGI
ncbi:S8 family serine peptidase [Salinirubellus salinus]|uniref:S8 family serine peptidase n=1 Tax=Salinirubellus salinus TaxID=1364945 RepID=A0A9E7UD49_9EURY|nr:S8 family serine peptidase [Salinirubellus salinus]UWM56644.1 S8 family serine peptidase [Salinirubellus salinus]